MGLRRLKVVRLGPKDKIPIWEMLRVEEGLFRNAKLQSNTGWLLMNHPHKAQRPTVVLGFSGKPAKLVNEEERAKNRVGMLRRFTGGGTVVVDYNTVFVTWFLGTDLLPGVSPFPRAIMDWSGDVYSAVLRDISVTGFSLRENDYCINNVKIGGNAQSISGDKWLHHTSFLWDFDEKLMNVLKVPEKQPEYRANRGHSSFLLRMKDTWPKTLPEDGEDQAISGPKEFLDKIEQLAPSFFGQDIIIESATFQEAVEFVDAHPPNRQVTKWEDCSYDV